MRKALAATAVSLAVALVSATAALADGAPSGEAEARLGAVRMGAPPGTGSGFGAPPQALTGLNPGGLPDLKEHVPAQFVFVGYDWDDVDLDAFRSALPSEYQPIVRSRLWYGVTETLGLQYTYDVSTLFAPDKWEQRFFTYLKSIAKPAPLTIPQEDYNAQQGNVLDIEENVVIDAPSVERWLIANAPYPVDPRKNTVFFVNWFGRTDFVHHVYAKTDEPDPDTGTNFGERNSRKMIAWGGTAPDDEESGYPGAPARVWFHDLSAGPESWTSNWNVDDEDVDGDGSPDYRMPPIWEYTEGGYRDPSGLTGDLGKIARYVAIDLLFTTSPIYPPYLTPTKLPGTINLDLNTAEGIPGVDASGSVIKQGLLTGETGELLRRTPSVDSQDFAFAGKAKECYVPFAEAYVGLRDPFGPSCYPERPYPTVANLFLYGALNRASFVDGGGDYEAMAFNYAITDDYPAPFLGLADDNWIDGTQSFVYNLFSPDIEAAGYGLTTTLIHEYGHHWALSHPHDGVDWEDGIDFGPGGDFFFAWSGDESNSMMSYIDLNWDFSQFDRDNYDRFLAAAYMVNANAIVADVLASPKAWKARGTVASADASCSLAKLALAGHDYHATVDLAGKCYGLVRTAAAAIGVPVTASENGWTVLPAVTSAGVSRKLARGYAYDSESYRLERRFWK
jgi:hypothetical protein